MRQRLLELAGEQEQVGQLQARPGMGGVELDHALEIVEGALRIALGQQDLGQLEAGRDEVLVDLERVAEFQRRLLGRALLDELEAALEVLGDALLGAVAGGERQESADKDGETAGAADHGHLAKRIVRVLADQR